MKSKNVAQRARDIVNADRKYTTKALVKLICDHAIIAAELKFVGLYIPMVLHMDIIDDVRVALIKHGFNIRQEDNRMWVTWTEPDSRT